MSAKPPPLPASHRLRKWGYHSLWSNVNLVHLFFSSQGHQVLSAPLSKNILSPATSHTLIQTTITSHLDNQRHSYYVSYHLPPSSQNSNHTTFYDDCSPITPSPSCHRAFALAIPFPCNTTRVFQVIFSEILHNPCNLVIPPHPSPPHHHFSFSYPVIYLFFNSNYHQLGIQYIFMHLFFSIRIPIPGLQELFLFCSPLHAPPLDQGLKHKRR